MAPFPASVDPTSHALPTGHDHVADQGWVLTEAHGFLTGGNRSWGAFPGLWRSFCGVYDREIYGDVSFFILPTC